MNENLRRDAMNYFGKKAFTRLFSLFKNKIESLGYVSGSVKFTPTDEEKTAIEAWMGNKIKTNPVIISLSKFEKRLPGSRYEPFCLFELVEMVTKEPIIPKKEREMKQEERKQKYYSSLLERFPHPNAQLVIQKIRSKEKGSSGFIASYNEKDYSTIEIILKAISNFPNDGDFERLPIFSERITRDPHYFDKNKRIYQAIEMLMCDKEKREYRSSLTAEDETNLLSLVNLDKDDLHSFVTCFGLEAYRNGELVQQWHWANKEGSVQNIPLRSLRGIDIVKPISGKRVFVLENSGVYSSVLDKLDSVYSVVCTHGNFKLSAMLLFDKLIKGGAELYYSGDIDVNGIMIANYLKNKYPTKVHIWRMGLEEYLKSISNVTVSATSLEKFNFDETSDFYVVANEMKKVKKAGYQEPLLYQFINDIKRNNNTLGSDYCFQPLSREIDGNGIGHK